MKDVSLKKKDKKPLGELIFGVHPLLELLKAKKRKLISIYTTRPEPKAWNDIKKQMPKYPVAIQYVKRDILHKMAGTTDHQGIVSWVQAFGYRKKFFNPEKHRFLVMLDGIQDPRNVGAILRSSYCTGADGIILIKKGSSGLTAVALKASAGLAEHMEIFVAPSAQSAVQLLKEAGYAIYTAVFDGQNATQCVYKQPLCLVIGSEGFGVSKSVLKDGIPVTIAQKEAAISYNASVAAGILLFLIGTQIGKI